MHATRVNSASLAQWHLSRKIPGYPSHSREAKRISIHPYAAPTPPSLMAGGEGRSAMKTILLHVQDGPNSEWTLQNALTLSRSLDAHLHCLQVTPMAAYVGGGGLGGPFEMGNVMGAIDQRADEFEAEMRARLANEDVSWTYRRAMGDAAYSVAHYAGLADLVIGDRGEHGSRAGETPTARLGRLMHLCRSPVFIPGDDQEKMVNLAGRAIIAWDGSHEAAHAARWATPLLQLASNVRVVRVEERDEEFPSTQLLEYLSHYGIKAELSVEKFSEGWVDTVLLSHSRRDGDAYLVLGGYSHRRVTELLFGGVTRRLLKDCPVGIVMAH